MTLGRLVRRFCKAYKPFDLRVNGQMGGGEQCKGVQFVVVVRAVKEGVRIDARGCGYETRPTETHVCAALTVTVFGRNRYLVSDVWCSTVLFITGPSEGQKFLTLASAQRDAFIDGVVGFVERVIEREVSCENSFFFSP